VRARVRPSSTVASTAVDTTAQLTVVEFAASLSAEVELENIAAQLGRVVHEVVEPHHLSLWVIDGTSTARTPTPPDRDEDRHAQTGDQRHHLG
jgi:hypothetical protein